MVAFLDEIFFSWSKRFDVTHLFLHGKRLSCTVWNEKIGVSAELVSNEEASISGVPCPWSTYKSFTVINLQVQKDFFANSRFTKRVEIRYYNGMLLYQFTVDALHARGLVKDG